jgi:hypothetical protein
LSIALPVAAVVFGSVAPPQTDILDLVVHLGATREVSSFSCLLRNFDKKYSPGGTYPILIDSDGSISAGRNPNQPLLITTRTESIRAESGYKEDGEPIAALRVAGRCWGEKLFRKLVTKTYENQKGEAIVKDLIDYYVGLSHIRDTTELIENTDTTYSKLEYENTPVMDILKYIANSADKAGVIGFDFRVAPDAKFEFFPRNSKTSSVSLSERLEVSDHERDIFRKRDKIFVFGAAEKKYPLNGDSWTETLDINSDTINDWVSGTGTGSVSLDATTKAVGSNSIKHTTSTADYYGRLRLIIPSGWQPDCKKYPTLQFQIQRQAAFNGSATVILVDNGGRWAAKEFQVQADKWVLQKFNVGKKYASEWSGSYIANFNWEVINEIMWDMHFTGTGLGSFWVDNLFFNSARWSATYGSGQREYSETDEEFHSDAECLLHAKARYDYLSGIAEYLKVTSDVIDYGTTPILAGDRIWVTVPNENIDGYYRVISVEYHLTKFGELEATLELGKEPMLLADYLYALKSKTGSLSRYKIGRI